MLISLQMDLYILLQKRKSSCNECAEQSNLNSNLERWSDAERTITESITPCNVVQCGGKEGADGGEARNGLKC